MPHHLVRSLSVIATLALLPAAAAAQAKPPCDLLTAQEVAAVIGPGGDRNKMAVSDDICTWDGKGRQLTVTRVGDADKEQRDQHFRSHALILSGGSRDIKGLGDAARAYINTTGDQVTLSVVRGTTIWDVTLHQVKKGLQLDAEIPQLRGLAERLLKQ